MYLLSFPTFWTLSIERFWFWFWSILNGVTLKTSNRDVSCRFKHSGTSLYGQTLFCVPSHHATLICLISRQSRVTDTRYLCIYNFHCVLIVNSVNISCSNNKRFLRVYTILLLKKRCEIAWRVWIFGILISPSFPTVFYSHCGHSKVFCLS